MSYKVVEKFVSINGEGQKSGELAVFIRFAGCNLSCSYCDTTWANKPDVAYNLESAQAIYEYIKSTGVQNVTLTGGEPLLQENINDLIHILQKDPKLWIEIETNGSVPLNTLSYIRTSNVTFTMDYKLGESKMTSHMLTSNFDTLIHHDTVKFVVGSISDLIEARSIITTYNLTSKCNVYLSPVFGQIDLETIVTYMKNELLTDVKLQLQLHKIIWDPSLRGV
jgi:7-carboxy-7-deazaguanine synthase